MRHRGAKVISTEGTPLVPNLLDGGQIRDVELGSPSKAGVHRQPRNGPE